MLHRGFRTWLSLGSMLGAAAVAMPRAGAEPPAEPAFVIDLPSPRRYGRLAFEFLLDRRRSVREFTRAPLTLNQVGQLLWAAQGQTHPDGYRTAPSAGALYPLEIYVAAGRVEGLQAGVYRYRARGHEFELVAGGDVRAQLAAAALDQECVAQGAAALVIAAVYERTTGKYGRRGERYVHMEVGHAAQNVYLQAEALDLGTVIVGAFDDDDVHELLGMRPRERPLAIMPVGHPAPESEGMT